MKRELEALLFATDSPLTAARLKKIFKGIETKEIKVAVAELQARFPRCVRSKCRKLSGTRLLKRSRRSRRDETGGR